MGSGGHEVGKRLAARLGIAFYDKELLSLTAQDSEFDVAFLKKMDEKRPDLLSVSAAGLHMGQDFYNTFNNRDNAYVAVSKKMRELASKGSSVFVGRCSDYILREFNPVNIFITADINDRIKRKLALGEYPEFSEKDMMKFIESKDKKRCKFYEYYSHEKWGDSRHYNLCIDTAKIGIDGAVDLVVSYLERYGQRDIMPDKR